jgi:hypothetical protein
VKRAQAERMTNEAIAPAPTEIVKSGKPPALRIADKKTGELLRRVESGQVLRLADYVRAEEALTVLPPARAKEARIARLLRFMKRTAQAAAHRAAGDAAKRRREGWMQT